MLYLNTFFNKRMRKALEVFGLYVANMLVKVKKTDFELNWRRYV